MSLFCYYPGPPFKIGAQRAQLQMKQKSDQLSKSQQEKRYKFLCEQTDLFEHFINVKKDGKSPFAVLLEQARAGENGTGQNETPESDSKSAADHRHAHRRSEREEDADLLRAEEAAVEGEAGAFEEPAITHFSESPAYVKGGTMRPYQIEGLNWMISLFENGINGILADEMGLGKTLQTLSLLGYLKFYRSIPGPHLLIVPKSTLQNWYNESRRWIPDLDSFVFHGTKEERDQLIKERLQPGRFDVCITSYEMCLLEKAALRKVSWRYIVIDEAHRIKNENSSLSLIVREFTSTNRLLITGTPLQNNLHELWALLNFLLPDIFASAEDFDSWFISGSAGGEGEEEGEVQKLEEKQQEAMMQQLRKLLQPFLLRRLKADVEHSLKPKKEVNLYVGLSQMQRKWYQKILERDLEAVNGLSRGKEGKTRLLNIVMQLRKCANHPYLFDGAEPGPPYTTDWHMVENSGKMVVLDKLLARMKANGSRVLLFSQMSRMLDIFEDYCAWRGYEYCRIDGQTAHSDRTTAIDEFNRPGSEKFIFLLTTRAGGLGINLATADIVILFDSDWNPQVDLQAQDRAHRIGQQKQVCVFRFVTENTIEEKVIERALQKLRLDQLVIQAGRLANANKPLSQEEMLAMIRHGAGKIFAESAAAAGSSSEDVSASAEFDLEEILRRGEERTRELLGKYQNAGFEDLQRFSITEPSHLQFEGEDYSSAGGALNDSFGLLIPTGRRERRAVIESRATLASADSATPDRVPMPKLPVLYDFHFYPNLDELHRLYRKATLHHQRLHHYRLPDGTPNRDSEQLAIDTAEPLTEAEEARKQKLLAGGFSDWTKREFNAFCRACERHGRSAFSAIAGDMEAATGMRRTVSEIKSYSQVFWSRTDELADGEKIVAAIERGEAKLARTVAVQKLLDRKLKNSNASFTVPYALGGPKAKHQFTPAEDEFLLRNVQELGYGTDPSVLYPEIHRRIIKSPVFKFDFYLKTRTDSDLAKRVGKLISMLEREEAEEASSAAAAAGTGKKRMANRENWERVAEKAAQQAIHQLKSKRRK